MTTSDLEQALDACFVPGSTRSIVAAGLVRKLTLTPDTEAPGATIPGNPERFTARIALANLDEESQQILAAQIRNRLAGLAPISSTEVTFARPLFPVLK